MTRNEQRIAITADDPDPVGVVIDAVAAFHDLFGESTVTAIDAEIGDRGWRVIVEGRGRVK